MASGDKPKAAVGQYYLMEKIAQGGMAEIYKGLSYDLHGLKKTVVIKKILPHISASKEFIDSLIDEAKIAVTLSHGNIAQTYDLGKVDDDYFMVMEYVEGKSLSLIHKRCLALGKLIPIPYLCHFMSEVLSGLDYMHRRANEYGHPLHIIHRDISPQNLIVTYSGTVKIIDFGIAKAAFKIGATDSGILKGKFSYMSPEQARGDSIDHRSDVFSLGVIFHEMLTGKRLFKTDDNRETLRNVRRAKVPPPSDLRKDLPEELDRIVMKALARDRRHRYTFASDMRDDLLKFVAATYPDFKASDAGQFVLDLFHDEISKTHAEEEEMKTPHLIIDRTSSALTDESQLEDTGHMKMPPDMQEFFLESETSVDATEAEQKQIPKIFKTDKTSKKAFGNKTPFLKKHAYLLTATVGAILIIFAIIKSSHLWNRPQQPPPSTTKIIAPANPPDSEPKAALVVASNPTGATIYLDDEQTPYRTPTTIKDITTGKRHVLGLYFEGYRFWTREFFVHKGETLNFDVQLTRDFGALHIDSSPSGALVMLNGTPAGQTPIRLENVEPKTVYMVEVWMEGFEPQTQEVQIEAGKKKGLHITLKKAPPKPPQMEPLPAAPVE